jgi:hypothetical protein
VEVNRVLDPRCDYHMLLILNILVIRELLLLFLHNLLLAQVCDTLLPYLQIHHIFLLQLSLFLLEHVLMFLLVLVVLDVLARDLKLLNDTLLS